MKNARLLGLSMQELSCFKGWPVTFLTTGQYETRVVSFTFTEMKATSVPSQLQPSSFLRATQKDENKTSCEQNFT